MIPELYRSPANSIAAFADVVANVQIKSKKGERIKPSLVFLKGEVRRFLSYLIQKHHLSADGFVTSKCYLGPLHSF